jgi:hypothetical protein
LKKIVVLLACACVLIQGAYAADPGDPNPPGFFLFDWFSGFLDWLFGTSGGDPGSTTFVNSMSGSGTNVTETSGSPGSPPAAASPGGSDPRPSGRVFYGSSGHSSGSSGGSNAPRDLTPPILNLTQDHPDAFVRHGDTVNVTAEFSEPVAASPVISIDVADGSDADVSAAMAGNGTVWNYSWQVPEGHDGNATIAVAATDPAGNACTGAGTLLFTIDNTPPSLFSFDHAEGYPLTDAHLVSAGHGVAINATFDEPVSSAGIIVEVVNGTDADITANMTGTGTDWTYTWQVPEGHEGGATVSVAGATDRAGNVWNGTGTLGFVIDNTPPVLISLDHSPAYPSTDAHLVSAGHSVVINATFDEAMAPPRLVVDVEAGTDADTELAMAGTGTDWTGVWPVPEGHDGNATIAVSATDLAGNACTAPDTLGFVIDNTLPVLLSLDHAEGYPFTDNHLVCGSRDVVLNASFDGNVTSATITIDLATGTDADNVTAMAGSGTNWTYTWDVPAGHDNDTVAVTVTGKDIAGNVAAVTGGLSFTIDNTAPVANCSCFGDERFFYYDCAEPVYHFGTLWDSTVDWYDPELLTPSNHYGLIAAFPPAGSGWLWRGSAAGWMYEEPANWYGMDGATFSTYKNVMTDEAGNNLWYEPNRLFTVTDQPDTVQFRYELQAINDPPDTPPPVTDA